MQRLADIKVYEIFINLAVFSVCLLFFSLAACKGPGYLRNDGVDFMAMLHVIDSTQLCPDCVAIRTSRSRHCSVCGHCVERFDHHCPWINNCVGLRNHNYFFVYILFQALLVLITFSQGIRALVRFVSTNDQQLDRVNDLFDLLPHNLESDPRLVVPFMALLICVTGFFLLPLILLLYVQAKNFILGKTTMERFGRVGISDSDRKTRILNSGIRDDF